VNGTRWRGGAAGVLLAAAACTTDPPPDSGDRSADAGGATDGAPGGADGGANADGGVDGLRGRIGAACAGDDDCQTGYCIPAEIDGVSTAWPGGICTAVCEDACPTGSTCVSFGDVGLCMADCVPGVLPCRERYACHPELELCLPDCRDTWDCGSRFVCDQESGGCVIPQAPGGEVGAPCEDALDCASSICLTDDEAGGGWPGGMCTLPCASGDCGDEGACVRLGDGLFCIPACAESAACREGYVCAPAVSGCLPDCRAGWSCGEGFECGDDGTCRLVEPVTAALGDPCEAGYECETLLCLPGDAGFPGGTCAAVCGSPACDPASGCLWVGGLAYCVGSCAEASCRSDYLCDEALTCRPDCRVGLACDFGTECDADTGRCESVPPQLLADGEVCTAHPQCESGQCLLAPDTGFLQGVCTETCTTSCDSGLRCADLGTGSFCVPTCASGCPSHFVCNADGACVPSCRSGWPCPSGEVCRSTGLCRASAPGPGPGGK
jgi:hypothetical protein